MSKLYRARFEQNIPADVNAVWDFISSPRNLKVITTPFMGFKVISEMDSDKMYPGQIIAYKVSPIAGIKLNWVTEITHVKEGEYFVDEQRFGPYQMWHHKHFITPIEKGVKMVDIIDYKIPFGFLGDIANNLIVEKKLNEIFDFRKKTIEKIFGKFQ